MTLTWHTLMSMKENMTSMVTGRKDKSTEIEICDYGCRTERRNSRIVWQLFCSILLEKFSDGKHHKPGTLF